MDLIVREAVLSDLANFVTSGSGVVVGVPGVGKTTLLRSLQRRLRERDVPSVLVPIDRMGSDARAELRELFGFDDADQRGQFDQLRAIAADYQGGSGILIFDGFDAARKAQTQTFFLNLIRRAVHQLAGTWHVIVTVRTFDARRSHELLNLFQSSESGDGRRRQEADIHCRHFVVPPLDEDEVAQIVSREPPMRLAYEFGSSELRNLLRVPFHLWLLDRVTSRDPTATDWSGIRSESQLLGLFWRQLVTGAKDREGREEVLTRVTNDMVRRQQLSALRRGLYRAEEHDAWRSLFSDGILVEDDTMVPRVAFAHNILFDYAVSVLLLPDEPKELIRMLEADESRLFFLRPSLSYYFTRLWYSSMSGFWKAFWLLLQSEAPRARIAARLLPPTVVANEARRSEDWSSVAFALDRREPLAPQAVARILQGLRMLDVQRDSLWTEFFELAARIPDRIFAWDLGLLIGAALDRADIAGDITVLRRCGAAARSLLSWAWNHRNRQSDVSGTSSAPWADALIAAFGIPLVARTYATDHTQSHALLEPVLRLIESPTFPIEFLYRLCDAVEHIWPEDPAFVGAVYRTVFKHTELSDEATHFGSPVLPLSSTRRQDFSMCQYLLVRHAPGFLAAAPLDAAAAIIDAINSVVVAEHVVPYLRGGHTLEDVSYEFSFRGHEARYIRDLSSIWDQGRYVDDIRQLASALFTEVVMLAQMGDAADLGSIVDVFRDHATVAMLWAGLLRCAASEPQAFAALLHELCLSRPIQTGSDTARDLGRFLEAAATFFTSEQMLCVEESLTTLVGLAADDNEKSHLEDARQRLLARLPEQLLHTEAGKRLREQTDDPLTQLRPRAPDLIRPEFGWTAGANAGSEEDEWPVAASSQDPITSLCKQLDAFRDQWRKIPPTVEAVMDILPIAQKVWSVVVEHPDHDAAIRALAWSKVASCCEAMSRALLDPVSAVFAFCRDVLLASSEHPEPRPNPAIDSQYEAPGWSPDHPRNEAAQGLPQLAGRRPDVDVLEAIKVLGNDPVPSVRFLVALELYHLVSDAPDDFWQLATTLAEHEGNPVVQLALCDTLWRVAARDETRATSTLRMFASRLIEQQESPAFPETLITLAVGLALVRANEWAMSFLDLLLSDPVRYAEAIQRAVFSALEYIKPDQIDEKASKDEAERARSLIMRAIHATGSGIAAFKETVDSAQVRAELKQTTSDTAVRAGMQALYRTVDQVIMQFLFDADMDSDYRKERHTPLTPAQRRHFFQFIKPVVQRVLDVPQTGGASVLLAPSAHHLMRLLRGMLAYDSRGALEFAARVAVASEASGYSLDSLAVRDMVDFVETVLADHRGDVRQSHALAALLTLLDVFARAGWPEALRLVWRLDEIYR